MRPPRTSRRWVKRCVAVSLSTAASCSSGRFSGWEKRIVGKLHVAVLLGGWSSEREVSRTSGNGVADALESLGHRVTRIDMGRDVALQLAEAAPDVVFNALHGTPGEDGSIQGM